MQINRIQPNFYTKYTNFNKTTNNNYQKTYNDMNVICNSYNITFGNRYAAIPDIDYEEYLDMHEATKKRFRKRYQNFSESKIFNKKDLVDNKYQYLPLRTEYLMDKFIKISSIYNKFKDHQIICLGRSPKWFLNTSLWMENGIKDYKFVAFSGHWYTPDKKEGLRRLDDMAPKAKEIESYRKYLKRIKADPKSIVENMHATGKKTIITDYIQSGKGACSFLEILGNFAKDQDVLEEFSKSIHIVGIGSRDYLEELNPYEDSISDPYIVLPNVYEPYKNNIKQEFNNMDYAVFREMLLNQNANECRSTYYPASAWLLYKPDKFKTGLIKDFKKVKDLLQLLPQDKSVSAFKPVMRDYRNLLNFRILDGLDARNLLKKMHKSKI